MRIAYVCADPGIPLGGHKGASAHLRSLAGALARRGHAVLLLARRLDGENAPPPNVQVSALTDQPPTGVLEDWHGDVVLERYSLASGSALEASRTLGTPFVLEVNAPLVDEAARYRGLLNVDAWRVKENALLKAADAIVAVSSGVRTHVLRGGVTPDRVVVVHNGVDLERFTSTDGAAIRRRYGLAGSRVVGFVGSLKPWHGVDLLLHAAAGLDPDVRLLIVGDGPQRAEVEALAQDLLIADRVILTGAVPHHAVADYLAAMTVAVAPYRRQPDFYFSPLKVAEYLAAGLPIVASRQGDLPDLLGEAGLLVNPDDAAGLAQALAQVLGDSPRRQRMQRAARQRARTMSWNEAAAQVEGVLARAIDASHAAIAQGREEARG